jgi:hypothetical protein
VKAILIDPSTKTISPLELDSGDYEDIRKAVFNGESNGLIEAVTLGLNHHMYVDEEGILKPWEEQSFFKLTTGQYLAGRAVILRGTEDGGEADVTIPIGMVIGVVQFVEPEEVRIPTPTFTSFEPDGTETVTRLASTNEWTIDNQP